MSAQSRRLVPILAALLLAVAVAAPVLAHAELVSSDPEDKAVLDTPPTTITLTFSEGLDAGKSSFVLSGPGGAAGTGRAAKDGATVMTLDGLVLGPGDYTIKWTSAALDGHLERGTLGFTVSEPTPAPATASPSPTPAPTPAPSATPTPLAAGPAASPVVATPSPSAVAAGPVTASEGTGVLVPIVAALVLVAGVGAFVLRRSRNA
jgi:copper resistance protein C